MIIKKLSRKNWEGGISDGLILPCKICKNKVDFDYTVDESFWVNYIPKKYRNDVICLSCLAELVDNNKLFAGNLNRVQFTTNGMTIILEPVKTYIYKKEK